MYLLGHVQDPGRGGAQERGEREADLVIETETEVDAEVAHDPGAGEEVVPEIAGVADPETGGREGIAGVDHERESAQALERGEGLVREMVEGGHDRETGGEVARGKGDNRDRGRKRGGGRHLGTGSSEGEAILARGETNSNSLILILEPIPFFLTNNHAINYNYTFSNYCTVLLCLLALINLSALMQHKFLNMNLNKVKYR